MNAPASSRTEDLLRDAQAWLLISRLLERPRGRWHDDVRALGEAISDPVLKEAVQQTEGIEDGDYLDAFGPSGVVSPREAAHGGMRDPGHLLADLQAAYEAFAYRPRMEEPLDHIATEAGFVGYLHLKEAFAHANGDQEHANVCSETARRFVDDHIRGAATAIAERLAGCPTPHLFLAANALVARVGPAPAPTDRRVMWLQQDDAMTCGQTSDTSGNYDEIIDLKD